ncbi:hypothetical protein ACC848_40155, partial [Rhizobium johnstonii]
LRYRPWSEGPAQQAERQSGLVRPLLTASTGLVYQTPLSPLAAHAIYYDDPAQRWGLFGHIGYLLFRERALQ